MNGEHEVVVLADKRMEAAARRAGKKLNDWIGAALMKAAETDRRALTPAPSEVREKAVEAIRNAFVPYLPDGDWSGHIASVANAILSSLQGEAQPVAWRPTIAGEISDAWAERFCEAVNWVPDGQECKTVEGEFRCVSFRDLAKGYLLAAIATDPGAHPSPEQASITCAHEPYQGSCAHCGVRFVNGRPHPSPEQAGEVERLPSISYDGPYKIGHHRQWLARKLLDSKIPDDEAFGIVANSPAVSDAAEQALADMKAERDTYRLVAVNQGWNWKLCATFVDEDAYRAHREQHVDDCAVAVRARLSKGAKDV